MEHTSLLIFSISLQAAVGIMVFVFIARLVNSSGMFRLAVTTAAVLAVVGIVASLIHLGKPASALNSLSNFGSSWLSREIWFTAIFTIATFTTAFLIYMKPNAKNAITASSAVAAGVGLLNVYAMAAIYSFTSVPAWQYGSITIEFFAAAITMGGILFLALSMKEAEGLKKAIIGIVGITVVVQVAAMVLYYLQLGANESLAAQQSFLLLNEMGTIMAVKWISILLGAGLLFFIDRQKGEEEVDKSVFTVYGAAALLVVGQIAGRYIIYAIETVSKVG